MAAIDELKAQRDRRDTLVLAARDLTDNWIPAS